MSLVTFNGISVGGANTSFTFVQDRISEAIDKCDNIRNKSWELSQVIYFAATYLDCIRYSIKCEFKEFEYLLYIVNADNPTILCKVQIIMVKLYPISKCQKLLTRLESTL